MFCLVVLEVGARLYVQAMDLPRRTHLEFRHTHPEPYKNADYYSEAFVEESFLQPGGHFTPEGTRMVIPNDFSGHFFNVRNGQRMTTNQPENPQGRVFVFGGSTAYNSEVPDNHTLGSYLQRYFPTRRVENYGSSSVTISQQLARLKTVEIGSHDIVIFFDGVNDVTQSIYKNNLDGWIVQSNREATSSFMNRVMIALNHYSVFVRYFIDFYDTEKPNHLVDEVQMASIVKKAAALYAQNIEAAKEYVESAGGTFYHFLQPTLFTGKALTAYEQKLIRNPYLIPVGWEIANNRGYQAFSDVMKELRDQGVRTYDIRDTFVKKRLEGEELFFDNCHVNHKGNLYLAERIASYIKR